jgi:hypothetical protein
MPTSTMLPGAAFPQREQFFRRGLNLASAKGNCSFLIRLRKQHSVSERKPRFP